MGEKAAGTTVDGVLAALAEPGRSLAQSVRSAVLALGGVQERLIVDYDVQDESPAFYVGARQLCHVHPANDRVEVTVSLSRSLTFTVLAAKDVPDAIRGVVERTKEYGATRWVAVRVDRAEDVPGLLAFLRHKHRYLYQGEDELAIPKDQTTLEKFE